MSEELTKLKNDVIKLSYYAEKNNYHCSYINKLITIKLQALRAFNLIVESYPINGYGTILLEDKYPITGDSDFNDVVLRYNIRFYKLSSTLIITIFFKLLFNQY